tara:strand:- start:20250 stop:21134 length:885 start_codon:yes stop_codon:yes gene_type:complete
MENDIRKIIEKEKNKILKDLRHTGFAKSHIFYLLRNQQLEMYTEMEKHFENMNRHPLIIERIKNYQSNVKAISGPGKAFENNQFHYLNRALTLEDSSVIQFHLNNDFLDIAESYLEAPPRVRNILTWLHPSGGNQMRTRSQRWHRDQCSSKMLKIFVYMKDITEKQGPLQYVSSSKYGAKNNFLWPNIHNGIWETHGYLDQKATSEIPRFDVLTATGPPGTIIFVDTNGIHRGGFVEEGIRMKTHALYLRPDAEHIVSGPLATFNYNAETLNFCDYNSSQFRELTERQRRVLKK